MPQKLVPRTSVINGKRYRIIAEKGLSKEAIRNIIIKKFKLSNHKKGTQQQYQIVNIYHPKRTRRVGNGKNVKNGPPTKQQIDAINEAKYIAYRELDKQKEERKALEQQLLLAGNNNNIVGLLAAPQVSNSLNAFNQYMRHLALSTPSGSSTVKRIKQNLKKSGRRASAGVAESLALSLPDPAASVVSEKAEGIRDEHGLLRPDIHARSPSEDEEDEDDEGSSDYSGDAKHEKSSDAKDKDISGKPKSESKSAVKRKLGILSKKQKAEQEERERIEKQKKIRENLDKGLGITSTPPLAPSTATIAPTSLNLTSAGTSSPSGPPSATKPGRPPKGSEKMIDATTYAHIISKSNNGLPVTKAEEGQVQRYAAANNRTLPLKLQQGKGERGEGHELTTDEVDKIMSKYNKLGYLGAPPRDRILDLIPEIEKNTKSNKNSSFIFNTDPHNQPGQHWVACFIDLKNNSVEIMDSFGRETPDDILKDIKSLVTKGVKPKIYMKFKENSVPVQSINTVNCGLYACRFLIDRYRGKDFQDASGYKQHLEGQVKENEQNIKKFGAQYGFGLVPLLPPGGPVIVEERKKEFRYM